MYFTVFLNKDDDDDEPGSGGEVLGGGVCWCWTLKPPEWYGYCLVQCIKTTVTLLSKNMRNYLPL